MGAVSWPLAATLLLVACTVAAIPLPRASFVTEKEVSGPVAYLPDNSHLPPQEVPRFQEVRLHNELPGDPVPGTQPMAGTRQGMAGTRQGLGGDPALLQQDWNPFKAIKKGVKAVGKFLFGSKAPAKTIQLEEQSIVPPVDFEARVEDCVACKFIWSQVEMDVGESKVDEVIHTSFVRNCVEAQEAPIFFPACQDMFTIIDDMIGDYIQDFTVNQLCENNRICRIGVLAPGLRRKNWNPDPAEASNVLLQ